MGHEQSSEKIEQALLLHECGRLDEARLIYQEIIKENHFQPPVLNLYGTLLLQQGFHGLAVAMLKKAIAATPDNEIYYNSAITPITIIIYRRKIKYFDQKL